MDGGLGLVEKREWCRAAEAEWLDRSIAIARRDTTAGVPTRSGERIMGWFPGTACCRLGRWYPPQRWPIGKEFRAPLWLAIPAATGENGMPGGLGREARLLSRGPGGIEPSRTATDPGGTLFGFGLDRFG